jgi:hypothetical protein
MAVTLVGNQIWLDITHQGRRWRGPVAPFVAMRAMDPTWLARWGLTPSSDLTDRATIEAHIELAAQAEWIAFASGTGPDPRKPSAALAAAVLLARSLCGQWFEWRCGNGKPFKSQSETASKLAFVQRWLEDRPATDLLDAATYRDFAAFIAARGSSTAATAAYVASVLRPSVLWGLSPQQGRLTGESPFGPRSVVSDFGAWAFT